MHLCTRLFAAVAGVGVLGLMLSGCGAATPSVSPTLCLATDFSTAGPAGSIGMSAQDAVDLAVDQAALGGGYTLTTLHYNSENAKQGAVNMTDAASQECTRAFIGPNNDDIAAAELPIASNAGLPMLTPGLTNPALTNAADAHYYGYSFDTLHPVGKANAFFRLLATDDLQTDVAVKALRGAGAARIYIVDDGQAYGTSVGDFAIAALGTYGGTLAGRGSLTSVSPAMLATLSAAIAEAKADGVLFAGSTAGAAALRDALSKPLPFVVMGAPATDPAYVEAAGNTAEGTLAVTAAPDVGSLQSAAATQFASRYMQRYGSAPTPLALSAYDAAEMVIATLHTIIASGNVPYLLSVFDQVESQRYTGIAGSYWFTTTGDNVFAGPINLYVVHGGSWVLSKSVLP